MSPPNRFVPLLLALALAACSRIESPEAASGAVAADAGKADREEASARDTARRAAEARGEASARLTIDRFDASERERVASAN